MVSSIQRGIALIELAIVGMLLIFLIVAATDYSLVMLARQEVHAAARVGVEYAANNGFSSNGITAAVSRSKGTITNPSRFSSLTTTASLKCSCDPSKLAPNSPVSVDAKDAVGSPLTCPAATGASCSAYSQYAVISVSGGYKPLFKTFWFGLNSAGVYPIDAYYVVRTFVPD